MLIPTTTSSGWITKSGTANFARKRSELRNTRSDEAFLRTLERNQEWVDLELLLRELNELGARPLLLSMPIHGGWYDQCGVTYTARRAYYEKLREIGARYHAPVVDFADHDADRSFCHDTMGHLAPGGLVYYSQVLDGFFHDAIPRQSELPSLRPWRAEGPKPVSRPGRPRVPTALEVSTTRLRDGDRDRASGRIPNQLSREKRKAMSLVDQRVTSIMSC